MSRKRNQNKGNINTNFYTNYTFECKHRKNEFYFSADLKKYVHNKCNANPRCLKNFNFLIFTMMCNYFPPVNNCGVRHFSLTKNFIETIL